MTATTDVPQGRPSGQAHDGGGRRPELRRDWVRLPDQRNIPRRGDGARGPDGCHGRPVARIARGVDADRHGLEGRLNRNIDMLGLLQQTGEIVK